MRLRLPLLALAVIAFFMPVRAGATTLSVCNNGSVTLNVARVIYSQSFFFGKSYQVSGWYEVAGHKCEVVYESDSSDAVYLGFMYHAEDNKMRLKEAALPDGETAPFDIVSQTFCAGIGIAFDYKTTTRNNTEC